MKAIKFDRKLTGMKKLTDYTSYKDAQLLFSKEKLWDLFDGDDSNFNITHECVDRHVEKGTTAVSIAHADGHDEIISFEALSQRSSNFAHYLVDIGIKAGDRVAVMLEPSLPFYVALFGAMKMGAVAVPMFTLFGPDGIKLRVEDCMPKLMVTNEQKAKEANVMNTMKVVVADDAFLQDITKYENNFAVTTKGKDLAVLQYTSGTTRLLPAAVRHTHKSIVTLMVAALYATGIRPGDKFFCPSSPAWGHGLWHGTLSPLALGVSTGTYSGRFDAVRLLKALQDYKVTNLTAAATHYRMMKNSGEAENFNYSMKKLTFTGEPIDSETEEFTQKLFKTNVCSMYGTTEIGVILANYPAADDFEVVAGSLGKAVPGTIVEVHGADGKRIETEKVGELVVKRRDEWVATKDLGRIDKNGYFYHHGRADDVIISAGWTMSAVEIEDAILRHEKVLEVAAIGVPDAVRGQVVKAYVVTKNNTNNSKQTLTTEIQDLVKERLSRHEYPRHVEFVDTLPKTPVGKVNRKILRDQVAAAAASAT